MKTPTHPSTQMKRTQSWKIWFVRRWKNIWKEQRNSRRMSKWAYGSQWFQNPLKSWFISGMILLFGRLPMENRVVKLLVPMVNLQEEMNPLRKSPWSRYHHQTRVISIYSLSSSQNGDGDDADTKKLRGALSGSSCPSRLWIDEVSYQAWRLTYLNSYPRCHLGRDSQRELGWCSWLRGC